MATTTRTFEKDFESHHSFTGRATTELTIHTHPATHDKNDARAWEASPGLVGVWP